MRLFRCAEKVISQGTPFGKIITKINRRFIIISLCLAIIQNQVMLVLSDIVDEPHVTIVS